jgi:hypothetical protein
MKRRKRHGRVAYDRSELYKLSKTVLQALDRGASPGDLAWMDERQPVIAASVFHNCILQFSTCKLIFKEIK